MVRVLGDRVQVVLKRRYGVGFWGQQVVATSDVQCDTGLVIELVGGEGFAGGWRGREVLADEVRLALPQRELLEKGSILGA